MSSAMKRPAKGGKERPAKKPRTLQPIGQVAREDQHVFISLQGSSERVGELFEGGHSVVFIRSGVATGKTTWAEHLARQFDKYVMVPFTGAGKQAAWQLGTVEAIEKATGQTINKDDLAFRNALKLAANESLTLVYDEAHTLFASSDLCSALFKGDTEHRPKLLLFSASGDASVSENLTASTPGEITQKFMWAPPLIYTNELETQLREAGVRLDQKSIEFFIQFCGGHRGIFIAAMHWVQSKQTSGESWDFKETAGFVRNSHGDGRWDCSDAEILGALRESRAVKVNGRYSSVENTPKEFVELLCGGARTIGHDIRRELAINGFVLPRHDSAEELQKLNWTNDNLPYKVANPLLAAYYRFQLQKTCGLELEFCSSKPESCADLLMRALPYLFFSKVVSFEEVTSELGVADGLPHEPHYSQAIISVLTEMGYKAFAPQSSKEGHGKPDLIVNISGETFVMEGARSGIKQHLERFNQKLHNYKDAKHKGLCIIGNDNEKMEKTVRKTEGGEVQIIGLVPNIAHTAYAVYVKSKGIELINTFKVDCDLVAKRLVLKDNGKPELYSVQSLKSVNLSPKAQSRR